VDSRKQSMIKSIVWRIMGVVVLGAVTYYFTRRWVITTLITLVHHSFFLVVFYLHERLWEWYKTLKYRLADRLLTVVKAFTYEIILGMGFGGLIVYFFTGSFPMVTRITGTYTIIKLVMYYFYDQI